MEDKVKDVELSILQDVLTDVRDQRGFFKKLCILLCSFVFVLIIGIVALSISNQKTMKESSKQNIEVFLDFLKDADVVIDTTSVGSNNVRNN